MPVQHDALAMETAPYQGCDIIAKATWSTIAPRDEGWRHAGVGDGCDSMQMAGFIAFVLSHCHLVTDLTRFDPNWFLSVADEESDVEGEESLFKL